MFGFINILKPVGMTSFAVIARLRKILGIKKIGHAGTLDPFAEGVLPIAVGKATRLIDFLSDEKEYIAKIQFGADTDSYDIDGNIIKTYQKKVELFEIEEILPKFIGNIAQIPPKFSAIKQNGKKLCDLARKGQEIANIEPRNIHIENIKILEFDEANQTLKIQVKCSKGTYIRSLGYDIGQELSCGAYLVELIRTNSSGFLIENACSLEDENLYKKLENPLEYLNLPTFNIDKNALEKVICGNNIKIEIENLSDLILLYEDEIVAIGSVENATFTVKKVFYEKD